MSCSLFLTLLLVSLSGSVSACFPSTTYILRAEIVPPSKVGRRTKWLLLFAEEKSKRSSILMCVLIALRRNQSTLTVDIEHWHLQEHQISAWAQPASLALAPKDARRRALVPRQPFSRR